MTNDIEVKRQRVFIVDDKTFNTRAKAEEYLERFPFVHNGRRVSRSAMKYILYGEKRNEVHETFNRYSKWKELRQYSGQYVHSEADENLVTMFTNRDFLKDVLKIALKYDKIEKELNIGKESE